MRSKPASLAVVAFAWAAILQGPVASAHGMSKKARAKSLFQAAYAASNIKAKGSPPFRLKAHFNFYNYNFQLEKGSYTELWVSSSERRTTFSVPEGRDVSGVADNRDWDKSTLQNKAFLEYVVGSATDFAFDLDSGPPAKIKHIKKERSGGQRMTCVIPRKSEPEEYCFDLQSGMLVQQVDHQWDVTYRYSDYKPWDGKVFPGKIQVTHRMARRWLRSPWTASVPRGR